MKCYKVNEEIIKYKIGNPFNTEIIMIDDEKNEVNGNPFFYIDVENEIKIHFNLEKNDKIFGLGENIRGINKRGWIYESFCTDDPNHAPDKKALYGAHNFFIVDGVEKRGVYIDFPGSITYDVGYTDKDKMSILIEGKDVNIYIINGVNLKDIVNNFLKIIGKSYIPPKWAFGYIQSRWSYPTGADVENIANEFFEREIPCDGICLDIDYMEDFKDFTLSEERFPNFKNTVEKVRAKGIKIIPIIDAGVKIEKNYDVYEEGVEKGYFALNKEGKPFVGAVWPGKVHFPDFLNKEARLWFGKKYEYLIKQGVEGFWNDMNEPAIFYSEDGIKKAFERIDELKNEELNIYSFFNLKDTVNNLSNSREDYKAMYHKTEDGIVNHYDIHNLYGFNMTRSAAEGFDVINEDKRYLLFSRASSIGAHRYGGIWTGDNCSWWEHLLLNIKMMPSLNMCGFLYSGADTAGFGSHTDSELAIRWNQFSVFTPLYRNHSAMGTRRQEPFAFDVEVENILKNTIRFRYSMIPYLYSEFMKAANASKMMISPLGFEYDDEHSGTVENQLLIGESIMVAPVYEQNARGRYVYLPEDMLLLRVKEYNNRELEILSKGHHYVDVDIDEICIFIRKDKMFVQGNWAQCVDDLNNEELSIVAFVNEEAEYDLYDDDGISKIDKNESLINIKIEVDKEKSNITIKNYGNKDVKKINFTIITLDGREIKEVKNL